MQHDRFDTGAELAPLASLGGGAVASFTGIARTDAGDSGAVTSIELEHYPAMTQAALHSLVDAAESRWDLLGCVLIHRIGKIAVGEEIVLVGATSLHRDAALSAVSFLMDRLKTDAPFWKKEFRGDGDSDGIWVESKSTDDAASDKWDERQP